MQPDGINLLQANGPGAAQSVIRMGNVGVARSTPDYFPLRVLNTLLGGSFTSRLNQNLRETHGYTYGARSAFDMRRLPGPFVATASVVTAKTDSSLIEFFKELRRIRTEPERFGADSGTIRDNEITQAQERLVFLPHGDVEKSVGANDEENAVAGSVIGVTKITNGVHRVVQLITGKIFARFGQGRNEVRMLGTGQRNHGVAVRKWREVLL